MSRVFRSRVYGRMNKRGRCRLGLQGHRREDIWRRMAEQEDAIATIIWWRGLPWWHRAWLRVWIWLRKALRKPYKRRLPGRSTPTWSAEAGAPHSATGAAAGRR